MKNILCLGDVETGYVSVEGAPVGIASSLTPNGLLSKLRTGGVNATQLRVPFWA